MDVVTEQVAQVTSAGEDGGAVPHAVDHDLGHQGGQPLLVGNGCS